MVEYGYINENGCLVSKFLEEYSEKYKNDEGNIEERIVSIDEQIRYLSEMGWKPVDLIEDNKLICPDNHSVQIIPYDAGERISYHYEQIFDTKQIERKICKLKLSLTSNDSDIGDYRITKCYEASLMGIDLPYDISNLYQRRQAVRNEINQLEELISSNK